ncbi:cyclic AMP-dependent transcription factor ATF-7-like isoform X2 [Ptychodera flava]|uniref:cyclic AMP-dependent transcription factor ATF-7-like isoform X2 n=1 Tax=Ptychodera flava TaxID=63121 RepID=UPI00396A955F
MPIVLLAVSVWIVLRRSCLDVCDLPVTMSDGWGDFWNSDILTMGDDDKPFACTAPGCGQRFTNEDHLTVHKQKHEMTLKFGPPKLGDILPVADQTPTPTRFLKNCEEVGLFNELPNVNPFEHEFKKAAEKQQSEKEAMEVVQSEAGTTTVIITSGVDTLPQANIISSNTEMQHSPETVSTTTIDDEGVQSSVQEPVTVATPISAASITTQAPSQMVAHIQPGHNHIPTVPIVLQLQNGATLPVALPVSVANPHVPVPTAISAFQHTVPAQLPAQTSTQSEAKLKLKAALTQGNMNVMSQAVEVVTRRQEEEQLQRQQHQQQQQDQQQQQNQQQNESQKRRRNTVDDPDQRRKKFLERNRAAAMRCRNKKKVWISSLEGKAEELTKMNHQLQNEVSTLRNEVAHLKQLLLAHKDCPITMLQQKTQHQILAAGHPVTTLQDHKATNVASTHQVTSVTAAEAVATSALTTMAQLATTELQTSQSSVTAN